VAAEWGSTVSNYKGKVLLFTLKQIIMWVNTNTLMWELKGTVTWVNTNLLRKKSTKVKSTIYWVTAFICLNRLDRI